MTTLADLIQSVLNETLIGTYRGEYNVLQSTITGSLGAHAVPLDLPVRGYGVGSIIEIDTELMYVYEVDEGGPLLNVIRGWAGTTPSTHNDEAVISMNPRFPRTTVLGAMLEEAKSWPRSVYRLGLCLTNIGAAESMIDVGAVTGFTDIIDALDVFRVDGSTSRVIPLRGWRYEPVFGQVFLNRALRQATAVRVTLSRLFDLDPWTESTDPQVDCGIPQGMNEVLKYGAAWRLVMGRETRRLFTESVVESRKAEDVQVQANSTLARQLKALRDARLNEEISRLQGEHGINML